MPKSPNLSCGMWVLCYLLHIKYLPFLIPTILVDLVAIPLRLLQHDKNGNKYNTLFDCQKDYKFVSNFDWIDNPRFLLNSTSPVAWIGH